MAIETRTIILASDGRHVTLDRESEPIEANLNQAASYLSHLGMGGWLVRVDGDFWGRRKLVLTWLRDLAPSDVLFTHAVEAFHAIRTAGNDGFS